MVESVVETTDGIRPRDRWTFWKDTAMSAVDGIHVGDASMFSARRSVTFLSSGLLVDTASSPLAARRLAKNIARDGDDGVCLMLLIDGRASIDHLDRGTSDLTAGSGMLFDLAQRYAVSVPTSYRETRLYMPRHVFTTRVGPIERLVGLRLPGESALTILFNRHVTALIAALPTMSMEEVDIALDGVLHLLSGLVATRTDGQRSPEDLLSDNAMSRLAASYIVELLGKPDLDVATLARSLGVSRATLYRAFSGRGGVAAAIRNARLDHARSLLAGSNARHQTLADVALACGFTDYPTFAKTFTRRFGMSPRDARGR